MTIPLVTVVIPTYNAPALLLETLETVFAQTFTDFEAVVINDGCTDDTMARLKTITDQRLRVITQENQGIGAARNRGIDEARGKYIAFLDHDDLWESQKLAIQVEWMERHPEVVACLTRWAPTSDGLARPQCLEDICDEEGIVKNPFQAQGEGFFFISSALMVRRQSLADIRYLTQRQVSEDTSFYIQLYARGPVGIPGSSVLTRYRQHAGNFSKQASYFCRSMSVLRDMERKGNFAAVPAGLRNDLDCYLASMSHYGLALALAAGDRKLAWQTYCGEVGRLIRTGHWRIAMILPFAVLLPKAVLRRRWHPPV